MLPSSEQVIRHVERHAGNKTRELAAHFNVSEEEHDDFVELLLRSQAEGSLIRIPHAGWDIPERTEFRVGFLEVARGGQGFVRVAAGSIKEDDVFVRPENLQGAFAGDLVLLRVAKPARGARSDGGKLLREGKVVDVVRRSRRLVRGRYSAGKNKGGGLVKVADSRFPTEIYVASEEVGEAQDGERVLVRLLDGAPHGQHPRGKVVVRLVDEGSHATDLRTICEVYELPGEHPRTVLEEAQALPGIRPGAAWSGRIDLRHELIFTVDPVDARDFDDAVSLERLKGGDVRLGVHIADVSHYVSPESALDREAENRGTSIYLPGRVLPMLPERLSNDLSSLRPCEDRLTKTVRMTFNVRGEVKDVDVFRSVIRSQRRFTYEEVLAILELHETGKEGPDLPPDHAAYADVLRDMAHLRDKLHAVRRKRGSLYLDIPKLRLKLDADYGVAGLGRDERDPSHALIEEFMLAANEAVAGYFIEKKLPLVARVHPPPEEKKLEELKHFVEALGFKLGVKSGMKAEQGDFQKLIDNVAGDPLSSVVQLGILRTMGHAEYVLGAGLHFALATSSYCHFTSPIRRYPDLLVHQLLDKHFDGVLAKATVRREWDRRLPHAAERASELERRAEEAEREMTTLRLIRYLKPLVGQEMEARIVSVHPFGFFVRDDETLVEGLVHVATLEDDYYELDRVKLILEGRRRRRRFALGDRVRVELTDVNADQREISFRFKKRIGPGSKLDVSR